MSSLTVHDIYVRHIRALSTSERLRLAALILDDLADVDVGEAPEFGVLELYGAAADNPVGMDAQEYVNQMRDEWDHRP